MFPPPPNSTLFPYTTLFRSRRWKARRSRDRDRDRAGHHRDAGVAHGTIPRRDRKSTRLNSSHVSISYAVFCLKKKKSNFANPTLVPDHLNELANFVHHHRNH